MFQQCFYTTVEKNCSIPCQEKHNLYTCQEKVCSANCGRGDCGFEQCLLNTTKISFDNTTTTSTTSIDDAAVSACQCKCFKSLGDTKTFEVLPDYPNFPICKDKFCECLDCFKMVAFERLVKKRRDECLSPTNLPKVSGNFVDCRYHQSQIPKYIKECASSFSCNTTTDSGACSTNTNSTTVASTASNITANITAKNTSTISTSTTTTTTTKCLFTFEAF